MSTVVIPADAFDWNQRCGFADLDDINYIIAPGNSIDPLDPPARIEIWSPDTDAVKSFDLVHVSKQYDEYQFELRYACFEPIDPDGEPITAFEVTIEYRPDYCADDLKAIF